MTNVKEDLVKRAFDACRKGDTKTLRQCFDYDGVVKINGVFLPDTGPNPAYPTLQDSDIRYDSPEEQGDGTVKTELRFRMKSDSDWIPAVMVDRIENGKITSSTIKWVEDNPSGVDDEAVFYKDKYGWWGWPFGRRW